MAGSGRRELLVSRGWVQAVVLTLLCGFLVLGIMGYGTYSGQPPIPEKVVDPMGFAVFCLRYLIPEERWSERAAKWSFWSLNLGLASMIFATLFPLGILQLYESVNTGYVEARSLEYVTNPTNVLIEWLRLPGDVLFIAGGVLPLLYLCYLGVRHTVPRVTMEEILFTETAEPAGPRRR